MEKNENLHQLQTEPSVVRKFILNAKGILYYRVILELLEKEINLIKTRFINIIDLTCKCSNH